MDAQILTPAQKHLLKLFSFDKSEAYARKIQDILTRHFQKELDDESEKLWIDGTLNQEELDKIRQENLHKK